MAQAEQKRRAQFLQDAAHLLVVPSPAAAAFLGRARDGVVQDANLEIAPKEYDVYRRDICGACGNVMVPGWSCKVSTQSQSRCVGLRQKDSRKQNTTPETKTKTTLECLRCHRETVQPLPPKPRRQIRKSRVRAEQPAVTQVNPTKQDADNANMKTANATSKQRQKARKGGLQAMLEKNKSQSTGLGGFDLMDFAM